MAADLLTYLTSATLKLRPLNCYNLSACHVYYRVQVDDERLGG